MREIHWIYCPNCGNKTHHVRLIAPAQMADVIEVITNFITLELISKRLLKA